MLMGLQNLQSRVQSHYTHLSDGQWLSEYQEVKHKLAAEGQGLINARAQPSEAVAAGPQALQEAPASLPGVYLCMCPHCCRCSY